MIFCERARNFFKRFEQKQKIPHFLLLNQFNRNQLKNFACLHSIKWFFLSPNRLRLADILVRPMQRLTKYNLLLSAIRKHITEENEAEIMDLMVSKSFHYFPQCFAYRCFCLSHSSILVAIHVMFWRFSNFTLTIIEKIFLFHGECIMSIYI